VPFPILLYFFWNYRYNSSAICTTVQTVISVYNTDPNRFLPERDYVTFGSLLSQFRLSSVTLVHPTHGVEVFGNISSPLCTPVGPSVSFIHNATICRSIPDVALIDLQQQQWQLLITCNDYMYCLILVKLPTFSINNTNCIFALT